MIKQMIKRVLNKLAQPILRDVRSTIDSGVRDVRSTIESRADDETVAQKMLMQQYRLLASMGDKRLPSFRDVGFRKYSEFDEDGILLFIFALISPINRTCVEICAGDGSVCNTANLIINHGWWGHLFDGNEHPARAGQKLFAQHKDTFLYPPRFTKAWITAENVNDLILQSGARGPIDLLSLDIDGMDYWVWKAISVIEPQVVVCETENLIPPNKALTVPYDPSSFLKLWTTKVLHWRLCANSAERKGIGWWEFIDSDSIASSCGMELEKPSSRRLMLLLALRTPIARKPARRGGRWPKTANGKRCD